MTIMRRQSIRTDRTGKHFLLSALAAILMFGVGFGFDSATAQTADREAQLRDRISSYWQAMEKGDYLSASNFVHPDLRNKFIVQVPKSRISKWEITELTFNDQGTECDAVVTVQRPFAMFGQMVDFPLHNQWLLQEGEWYLNVFLNDEGESPFVKLFKNQEESVRDTEALKRSNPPSPADSKEARDAATAFIGRLRPDQDNPSQVHFGEKAVFRYHYTNKTDSPIRILSINSDCHCTSIQREHPEVPPGADGTFQVILDTFGLPPGLVAKNLTVLFSDLPQPITVRLAVQNMPNFEVTPQRLDFGELKFGEVSTLEIRIVNQSGKEVKLFPALHSDESLGVDYSKSTLEAGEEMVVRLRYKSLSPGEFRDSVMVRTDLEIEPIINIWVAGNVIQ